MTGDGTKDAPALKKVPPSPLDHADVGFSIGIQGTDVMGRDAVSDTAVYS